MRTSLLACLARVLLTNHELMLLEMLFFSLLRHDPFPLTLDERVALAAATDDDLAFGLQTLGDVDDRRLRLLDVR